MHPRTDSSSMGTCYTSHREDGRFFAALRMTCFAITITETFRSTLRQHCEESDVRVGQTFLSACFDVAQNNRPVNRQNCHPEVAALSAGGSSAGRLTKDLLRHRLIPERHLSFAAT
jgi:hypothetical protein